MGGGSSIVIGYKYSLGMHMVLCHGPIDEIQEIRAGDRVIWDTPITTSSSINIDKPDLFGGEKKEGGVVGKVDIMMGEETQGKNAYLVSQLGSNVPGFRGVVSLVLNKVYCTAMSAYPKPWAAKAKSIPAKIFNPTKADINGSANPINLVYDLLTNRDYGLGYTSASIDISTFNAASDKLFDENFGLSFTMVSQDSVEKLLISIMSHINAAFYTRNDNGQFAIRLIRDDYNPTTLPVFNEDNIIRLEEFQRPSYAELVNEIVVVYQPKGSSEKDSVVVQDLAGIQVQQGIVSQTFNYPGIDTAEVASRVALRDLRQKSSPVAGLKIIVNRHGFDLSIGDVFKFSWLKLGIQTIIFRIISINYGNFDKGEIIISALEDVFGLPAASYLAPQPSLWTNPVIDPLPITMQKVVESTYYDVARSNTASELATFDSATAFFRGAAISPPGAHINFEFWKRQTSGQYLKENESGFCVSGLISAAITKGNSNITVTLTNISGNLSSVEVGTYCYLNDEMLAVISTNPGANQVVLGRAVIDTVPTIHSIGDRIFFFEKFNAKTRLEQLASGTHNFRFLSKTGSGTFDLNSATTINLTAVARFDRPYRPGNFTIGGTSFGEKVAGTSINFSWNARNRLQETASLLAYSSGVTSEPGIVYDIEIRGETNQVIFSNDNYTASAYIVNTVNDSALTSPAATRDIIETALDPVQSMLGDHIRTNTTIPYENFYWTGGGLAYIAGRAPLITYISPAGVRTTATKTAGTWLTETGFTGGSAIVTKAGLQEDSSDFGTAIGWTKYTGNGSGVPPAAIDNIADLPNGFIRNGDGVARSWTMFLCGNEGFLVWWANTSSNYRIIKRWTHAVHTISNTDMAAGTFNNTRYEFNNEIVALPAQFDSISTQHGASIPWLAQPGGAATATTWDNEVINDAVVVGDIVYIYYVAGTTSDTTNGKTVDVTTNLVDNHFPFNTQRTTKTTRLLVNSSGIVQSVIDTRLGTHLVCRTSTATTGFNGWEKHNNTIRRVNLQTGALDTTITNNSSVGTMVGDKENNVFYMHDTGGFIRRFNGTTGIEIDSVSTSVAVSNQFHFQNLLLSRDAIWLSTPSSAVAGSVIRIPQGANFTQANFESLTFSTIFTISSGQIRPASIFMRGGFRLEYKSNEVLFCTEPGTGGATYTSPRSNLIDESGQQVITQAATPRMNDQYSVTLDSKRGTVLNYQQTSHTINHSGYGLRYGEYYGG